MIEVPHFFGHLQKDGAEDAQRPEDNLSTEPWSHPLAVIGHGFTFVSLVM